MERIIERLKGKKVLFIATKNLDYIRITQEIDMIRDYASHLDIVCFNDKSYIKRVLKVYFGCIKMLISNKYDTVFAGFAPQLVVPFFWLNFFGKAQNVIIDFFISVYDTFTNDRQKFKENGIPGKIMKSIDKSVLKRCDFAICDTNAHGNFFAEEFECSRDKIITLYLNNDTRFFHPMTVEKPEAIRDKFVVNFFSSMLNVHGPEVVLEAVSLMEKDSQVFFHIIGPLSDTLRKKYSYLKNAEFIKWVSQDKLAEYIAMSDLCLGGHFNSKVRKAHNTVAGKTYIYLAMNKKVIVTDSEANLEVFDRSSENIYFVPMSDPQGLADKIEEIKESVISEQQ